MSPLIYVSSFCLLFGSTVEGEGVSRVQWSWGFWRGVAEVGSRSANLTPRTKPTILLACPCLTQPSQTPLTPFSTITQIQKKKERTRRKKKEKSQQAYLHRRHLHTQAASSLTTCTSSTIRLLQLRCLQQATARPPQWPSPSHASSPPSLLASSKSCIDHHQRCQGPNRLSFPSLAHRSPKATKRGAIPLLSLSGPSTCPAPPYVTPGRP